MENEQYAKGKLLEIGELLDGRYFYIPAYQRGYRWTEDQVTDLLRDLLCFANESKKEGDFYCLQPIIARPLTDEKKLERLFKTVDNKDRLLERGVWEIIDGQQRLTTIFLLYKYLLNAETLREEEGGKKELYHILYETRKDSAEFLLNIELDTKEDTKLNIDFYHMSSAFKCIHSWIEDKDRQLNQQNDLDDHRETVRNTLFSLLNGRRGSVKVLWYELTEKTSQSSIKEFQKINTGKIRLTDAELIKGLFLLNRNFEQNSKHIKRSTLALEWDFIENTLQANNFWFFLNKKGTDIPNRIDFLFSLVYKLDKLKEKQIDQDKDLQEKEISEVLKSADNEILDTKKSVIFRYYYNKFEEKQGEELHKAVDKEWQKVMNLFRRLDDWFCTPIVYNFVGLLSQFGEDITRLIYLYENMREDETQNDFVDKLKQRIKYYLKDVKVDEQKEKRISTSYSKRTDIYRLLLTLNIQIINTQNSKFKSESEAYKFPFDVFNAQNWDIEHIASSHTNELNDNTDKKEWIETAWEDLKERLPDKAGIEKMYKDKKYDEVIKALKEVAGETELNEEMKNCIGNLTLLDSHTNRSYGNKLFCTKRRYIIDTIKEGTYVPIATQYVFSKYFDISGTNRSVWGENDIEKYHEYIFTTLEEYIS